MDTQIAFIVKVNFNLNIREPQTPEEFEAYFHARWEILRKPWGHPEGSEKDGLENASIHIMATEGESIIGISRLTRLPNGSGQIRFMGVKNEYRNQHIGKALIDYLEKKAEKAGITSIFLNARDEACLFYLKAGYKKEGSAFNGFAGIAHTKMVKTLH